MLPNSCFQHTNTQTCIDIKSYYFLSGIFWFCNNVVFRQFCFLCLSHISPCLLHMYMSLQNAFLYFSFLFGNDLTCYFVFSFVQSVSRKKRNWRSELMLFQPFWRQSRCANFVVLKTCLNWFCIVFCASVCIPSVCKFFCASVCIPSVCKLDRMQQKICFSRRSQSVVWCGVVWCGVVWCGVVWLKSCVNRSTVRKSAE
jgi:hypothetical protein